MTVTIEATEPEIREEEFLKSLEDEGLLDQQKWAGLSPPKSFTPLEAVGTPLSQTILQDRE